jgi:hypothetical protein
MSLMTIEPGKVRAALAVLTRDHGSGYGQSLGTCLGGILPKGSYGITDPQAPLVPGCVCHVIAVDPDMPAGVTNLGKLFLGVDEQTVPGEQLWIFGAVSPPGLLVYPRASLRQVLRVVLYINPDDGEAHAPGVLPEGSWLRRLCDGDPVAPISREEPMEAAA